MSHMREAKTGNRVCVFVLVYVGLVTCSGAFGSFLSDDVCKLKTLSENIPSDYRISFNYISKSVGGACWLCLNLYPVESSLKTLSLRFGNLSANRANITIFITMLQGFRFDLDHEELEVTMQTFKCHYKRVKWASGRYFTHVREVLSAAGSMAGEFHDCVPPPCQTPQVAPITPGQRRERDNKQSATPGLLTLLIIPSMVVLLLIVGVMFKRLGCCPQSVALGLHEAQDGAEESRLEPHGGAAQGGPVSDCQEDGVWMDSAGCADTEV